MGIQFIKGNKLEKKKLNHVILLEYKKISLKEKTKSCDTPQENNNFLFIFMKIGVSCK